MVANFRKMVAKVLLCCFIFSSLPTKVLAETYVEPQVPQTEEVSQNGEKSEAKILKEIEEKREENIKHFLKDDNTYEAVVYPSPVHYKENGKWEDIDNTLEQTKDENGNDILENKKNDYKVKIAKKSNSERLIHIKKDKYELSWNINNTPQGTNEVESSQAPVGEVAAGEVNNETTEQTDTVNESEVNQQVVNEENTAAGSEEADNNIVTVKEVSPSLTENKSIPESEEKTILKNINSKVKYENIKEGVSLEYQIKSKTVKESIVLDNKIENPIFKFNINVKNLSAVLNEDKSISFYDDKDNSNLVYTMNSPFMFDKKGEISKDIEVILDKNNNGYILTLQPNKEWLDAVERIYPVVIDPSVITSKDINDIHDSYVAAGLPNTNYGGVEFLQIGKGTTTQTNRAYISFDLPEIESSNIITHAYLNLWLNQTNSTPVQIDVHKVKAPWNSSTITWNNKPDYNTKIEDYKSVSGEAGGYPFVWDITSIAKEWTSTGQNNGLMLKNHNESTGYNQFISSDSESGLAEGRPQAVIQYTDSSGLENHWTYHSQSVGRAGTGYVNDYNGNLIFVHNDLAMNGNRMPISINHVFNSNERDTSIGYGNGWRLNLSQRVVPETIEGEQKYAYTDEDGTKHYLKYNSTKGLYEDEVGIDITMTINSASTNERYTIKDKGDNKLIFTSNGYLYKIVDSNGNTAILSYNGTILKSITDGAGRTIQLDVNANGYLVGIIDPSGRRTSFAYTGINLTKITYTDGKYSTYTYDTYNNLKSAVNHDGYKINYQYYQVAPYRVSDIGEYGAENTAGMGLHINYGYNTTIFNDQDGKKNIYQFNDYGNTISVRDEYGNALYYKYGETGSESNKLKLNSKLQKPIMNYLKNHNAEIVGNWTAVNEYVGGDTDGSNIYDTTYKYLGKQSLRIKKVDPVKSRLYKQTLSLEKGKEYTFSAYVKTVGISNKNGKGASLFIKYQDETGTWEILDEAYIYISGTNDWERQEVNFTIPNNASTNTVEVNVGIVEEAGTAYFDCMQLEEGSAANRYNILENANFSYGMNFWTKNYECDSSDDIVTSTDATYPTELDKDKKVFKINGSASKRKNIYQKIDLSGKAGDVFVVSGWAKGDSVTITGTRYFALDVGIEKNDGSYEWKVVKFNEDSTEWQYVSDKIVTSADYKSITFYGLYYENENTAYFDGLQLYKEEFGQSYTYDDKGNVISTSDLAEQNSTFEYDDKNNLIEAVSPKGNKFKYTYYDNTHDIKTATSAENVVYTFSYDDHGNPETATVGDPATSSLTIKSKAGYTGDGNYISYVEDSSGNKVGYDYNTKKGTLDRVTDPKGNSVFYSYDEMDTLKGAYSIPASEKIEVFPLTRTSIGTKGSKPTDDNAVYEKDANGKAVLSAYAGTKVLYDLGLNKNAGTVGVWFNTGTENETRYILASEGTGSNIIHMYIGADNKLHAAVRKDTDDKWQDIINLSGTVAKNTWYFAALKWEHDGNNLNCTLQLNNTRDTGSTNDFKDFTGAKTAVGSYISGVNTLNGVMDEFIYSSEALSNDKLDSIFSGGRGNYLSQNYTDNGYTYEDDRIKSVTHNGFIYNFGYDDLGNNTTVAVGNQNLITNNYEARTSRLEGSVYGNGDEVEYDYDEEDRVTAERYKEEAEEAEFETKYKYQYNASGNLAYHEDLVNDIKYRYFYDASERLVKTIEKDKNDPSKKSSMYYDYDIESNLKNFIDSINGAGHITSYEYDKDSRVTDIYYNNPLKNVGNMENFPLNNTTTGSNGTKSYSQTGVNFAVDSTVENGKKVLTTDSTTKILYDLGIAKESGTMGVWFNTDSTASTRYILASEGEDNAILSMYLDANNYLNLAVRKKGTTQNPVGEWSILAKSTDVIAINTWNYAAFTWTVTDGSLSAKLYLNDKVYISDTVTTTDFKDFTGAITAVGGHNSGSYQLNGQLEQFSFYNTVLSDDEVKAIHAKGRGNRVNYSYDELGRLEERKLSTGVFTSDTTYEFEAGQDINTTTTRVNKISNDGKEITYTYDANGNIETITENGKVIKYYYDELNQLVREDNEVLNKTIVYTYDVGGNITSKKEHAYTTGILGDVTKAYGYEYTDANWKDVLTKFDGKTIEYDAIGNPKKYGVKNDNVFDETKNYQSYTWEHGRQLKSMVFVDGEGNKYDLEFKYNSSGIRTEKKVVQGQNTVITKYHLVADKVTYEDNGTDKIYYTYDNSDNLVSMNLNDVEYYYIRNAQGDIIGLFDGTGAQVVSYVYDSWGKLVSVDGALKDTVGVKNPYRYRGYRYDIETGLYYLNSRYYNAEWGRFINADGYVGETGTLLSCNMFAYCQNNIINYYDPSGRWLTLPLLGGVLTGVVETAAAILSAPVVVGGALVLATGFLIYSGYQYYTSRASSNSGDSSNDTAVNHQEDVDVEIVIPRNRYPETAQHVEDAIESGHPNTLTVDRSKAKSNRRKSLKGIPKVKGKDLDEYPPAMFKEGGAGSSVRPLNPSDNRGSGSWLGHKLRAFPDGTRVRIKVGPK